MSEFKRRIGIAQRSEVLQHKDCGGDATISVLIWKELIDKTEEPMKSIMGPLAKGQEGEKIRLIECGKCGHREVEEV